MSEITYCHNHPGAKAVASCHRCASDLCGTCGNYFGKLILCENCAEDYENEKYVSSQAEKLARPKSSPLIEDSEEEEFTPSRPSGKHKNIIPAIVIGICVCVISVQLYLYSNPIQVEQDPDALAREQAIASLVQCMLVFREIGLLLQNGGLPDDSMRCADSSVANIVSNVDGVVRVSHPNPRYYNHREISVSSTSPEPRLVRLTP